MRSLFWVVALFALAVGLSLIARYNEGYVIFVIARARVEMNLTLFVLLALLAFVLGYFFMRAAAYTLSLPERVRAFRAARTQAKARHSLYDAFIASYEGRYARALKAAAAAHESGEEPQLAALLAARAAHALERFAERDHWLSRADTVDPKTNAGASQLARQMTAAELLADERRDRDALAVFEAMNKSGARHLAAQRLALKVMTRAGEWEAALKLAHQLEEHRAIHPAVAAATREAAYTAIFASSDAPSVAARAKQVSAADRAQPGVARAIASAMLRADLAEDAARLIENTVNASSAEWHDALGALYADCAQGRPELAQSALGQAEDWQRRFPREGGAALTLGRLCAELKLWGKAREALDKAVSLGAGRSAYLALARVCEASGEANEANRYYRLAATA
jgi:HemY protein